MIRVKRLFQMVSFLVRIGVAFVTTMSTVTTKCVAHVTSKVLSGGGAED